MESTRLDKINRLLQKELGEIIRVETAKRHNSERQCGAHFS